MNLSEEQRQQVTAWIVAGAKLSEVQTRLNQEFGLKLTYMETRFLVDDLKLTLKDPEPPKTEKAPAPEPTKPAEEKKSPAEAQPAVPAGVSVIVDQIARPGALVSGKVTFSDGQKAEWYLDQMGRLGVIPGQQGYKPSAPDVQEFQMALQEQLQRMGL